METVEKYHITYQKPKVTLLQESGLGVAEIAARTCYDSFENSENECVKHAMEQLDTDAINKIEKSDLLANLAWVHHHHSIIEHATLSYLIRGTSRGVLQEHARHRLQNAQALYEALQCGKKKRNVGDAFKHIVSDNWKVDMVVTFNIRSLKNYFDLRDSGAA